MIVEANTPPPPPAAASATKAKPAIVTLTLTNNDSVYADIRNLSIEKLGLYMQEKVRTLYSLQLFK